MTKIEENALNVSANYVHLYEIGNRIEESQGLEVDEIILKACSKDREIQFGRKVAHLNSRAFNQDALAKISNEKVSTYLQTKGLYLETASVAFQVGTAVLGWQLLNSGAGACTTMAHYFNNNTIKAQEQNLSYCFESLREHGNTYSQQKQSLDRDQEQSASVIDRMIQTSRRQSELVIGG